jgi:sortase A
MGLHSEGAVLNPPPEPPAPTPQRSLGDKVRMGMRGIGQTLITGGLVVLLFVFYEVYVTTWFTDREQTKLKHTLSSEWKNGDGALVLPNGQIATLKAGAGIANIYIPRLGRDFAWTIVEGTSAKDLDKGPGHYTGTALPGQVGNFAIAGHRVGKGEPFLNLDHLKPGDAVIIQTATDWYVYKVLGSVATGSLNAETVVDAAGDKIPGREIITPTESRVLEPVPDHGGAVATDKLMTMTTCHPKFTASHRMILYAMQASDEHHDDTSQQTMPKDIQALYSEVS